MDRIKDEKLQFFTQSKKILNLLLFISKIAKTDMNVLITGESGTGKEIIANYTHIQSERVQKNFVAVNCAALPADLLEAELFGYKKGAFTGAVQDRQGLFETAEGGTVFLDEIGDMPLHLQAKLLRIIQQKKIRPLGGCGEKFVDFRLVSATHKCLKDEIKAGRFREDLYYRLNGISLHLPPLRERREDIPFLIDKFSRRFSDKYSTTVLNFSDDAMGRLLGYSWPGNVRQLEHMVEQMTVLFQEKESIELTDLPSFDEKDVERGNMEKYFLPHAELPTVSELTDRYIRYVYNRVRCHQGDAARILGISRRTVNRKLRDFYISSEMDSNDHCLPDASSISN